MTLNKRIYTINMLTLDPVIYEAPYTRMTLKRLKHTITENTIKYLVKHHNKKPYTSTLFLFALILEERNHTDYYIYSILSNIAKRFKIIFNNNDYDAHKFNATKIFSEYLYSKNEDGDRTKHDFFIRYNTALGFINTWFNTLTPLNQDKFLPFLLPYYDFNLIKNKIKQISPAIKAKLDRKHKVNLLMESFPKFRDESKKRDLLIEKIYKLFNKNKNMGKISIDHENLKYLFEILKLDDLNKSFILPGIPKNLKPNKKFIRLISIIDSNNIDHTQTSWLYDICKNGLFDPLQAGPECKEWLSSWKFPECGLKSNIPNFIIWDQSKFMLELSKITNSVFIPIEQLFLPSKFATLAIELITTNGMRINEVMQVNISKDGLVKLLIPIYKDNNVIEKKIRYSLRTIPKGENNNVYHDNFISNQALELISDLTKILQEHYSLSESSALPTVPYTKYHGSRHKFTDAPYIFQLNHTTLSSTAISNSIRFLLHGLNFNTSENKAVSITPHLLRHGFATHAVNVAKLDIDIIGKILHQKTLSVTRYYSEPTQSMIASTNDAYLSFLNNELDIDDVLKRSPEELRNKFHEYQSSCGTLANVIGGHCTSHGMCKAQFSCIGCAAKIPDPAQKDQLINQRSWAENQVEYYSNQGLFPEAQKLVKVINAVDIELNEIQSIEEFAKEKNLISIYQIDEDN